MTTELERWNARYADTDYVFGTAPNAFLRAQIGLIRPGSRVLSVADGEGRNSVFLAGEGMKVHAVEFSPVALAKARELARARGVGVEFEQADILAWDWPAEYYDAVVGIFIQFTRPDERVELFANMKRALKPGGLILMEGYGPRQLEYKTGGPDVLDQLSTPELLTGAFADWDILVLEDYDAEISEGARHKGLSHLIDFVARKP